MTTKKLTKEQLKKLLKESLSAYEAEEEKAAAFSEEIMRYPKDVRDILADLEDAQFVEWSSDAAPRGYWIPASKLVLALRFLGRY